MSTMEISPIILHQGVKVRKAIRSSGLNIIGLSSGYHDSACSLVQDGVLVAAAQEERFSRVKNDKYFPWRAFNYCLKEGGLSVADVDCVSYYEDPRLKLGRQLWMGMVAPLSVERHKSILNRLVAEPPEREIRKLTGYEGPIEFVDHHLSHAASAYYFSGFEDAAILTVDGVGDWPSTTYSSARGADIRRLEQVDFPDSLGFFYSAVTGYLGFEVNEGEYKVMGLAPYGQPRYVDQLRQLIEVGPKGQYQLNMKYFGFLREDCMYSEELIALLGNPPREAESELLQFHKDIARSVQVVLEEVMLEKVRYLHTIAPSENLCMAGGVALNVVANTRCLRDGPFRRLFVQPAAGDAGTSVGAAAIAYLKLSGKPPTRKRLDSVYLGPKNSSVSTERILRATSAAYLSYAGKEEQLLAWVVDRLIEGKVIGWSQGRMEFGPRSLGARSILADPRIPDMRDRINALVKMRESFRPFAPAVLQSEAGQHFDLDHPSPFMLETCEVVSPLNLPSITHVDGSARPQTVGANAHPRFARLLEEFYRRTGCPILLNTSFNMRGEPIVCSTVDAIRCFVRCKIDVIVLEDFVLERSGIPPLWEVWAHQETQKSGEDGAVGHRIYSLF